MKTLCVHLGSVLLFGNLRIILIPGEALREPVSSGGRRVKSMWKMVCVMSLLLIVFGSACVSSQPGTQTTADGAAGGQAAASEQQPSKTEPVVAAVELHHKMVGQSDETPIASVGAKAPDFTLNAYHKGAFKRVSLSDYHGQWVILCFYPGDFTFV